MIDISQINPGDEIEYVHIRSRKGGVQPARKKQTGTVVQVTKKFISLKGPRYPDTISIADLHIGKTEIVEVKEGEIMGAIREMPPVEELASVFMQNGYKINPTAKHYRTSWGKVRDWLSDYGLIDLNTGVATFDAKKEQLHDDHIEQSPVQQGIEQAEKQDPDPLGTIKDGTLAVQESEKGLTILVGPGAGDVEKLMAPGRALHPDPQEPELVLAREMCGIEAGEIIALPGTILKLSERECLDILEHNFGRRLEFQPDGKINILPANSLDNIIDISVQAITNPAKAAVRQVVENPMALEIVKELIRQGVV